jgi:hypothetical protein
MHYVKYKRDPSGRCNICGNEGPLTWDHVPPQGGIELKPVEMRSVFQSLTGQTEGFRTLESQNGVKYRTICKRCNETLGTKYDTVINSFAITVGRYLRTLLTLPPIVSHTTRPGALIRGILGHLLAAKAEPDEVPFDKIVAPLVFDETKPIPNDILIYYWLYPYDCSVSLRDFFISYIPLGDKGYYHCHVIKYFPIAYLITDRPFHQPLPELTKYRYLSPHEEAAIPIDLKSVRAPNWPETTDNGQVILGGQSMMNSIFATPKKKRR